MKTSGIFTVSLDFERMWGIQDVNPEGYGYEANIDGVDNAIEALLDTFNEYGIHSTWATVGLLFCKDVDELNKNLPEKTPHYDSALLNAYEYINEHIMPNQLKHFSPEAILKISKEALILLISPLLKVAGFLKEKIASPIWFKAPAATFTSPSILLL